MIQRGDQLGSGSYKKIVYNFRADVQGARTTNKRAAQEETAMTNQANGAATNATPFDRKNNIGLHHLALLLDNHAALDSLHERLQQTADVEIEFAPESLGGGEVRHMMTYVPGGIRVEFLSPSA
jgi:hypothetical protein